MSYNIPSSNSLPPHYGIKKNTKKFDISDIWVDSVEQLLIMFHQKKIAPQLYYLIIVDGPISKLKMEGIDCILNEHDIIVLTPQNSKKTIPLLTNIKGSIIAFSEDFYKVSPVHQHFFLEIMDHLKSPIFFAKDIPQPEKVLAKQLFEQCKIIYLQQQPPFQASFNNWRALRMLISTLLIYIQKRAEKYNTTHKLNDNYDAKIIVLEFHKLLDTYFAKEPLLKFYCDRLGIDGISLKNYCKQIVGISPKEIMQLKVLDISKKLLMNSQKTIQEIGYILGFNDPSNFNKFFLKREGITPKKYRINNKPNI